MDNLHVLGLHGEIDISQKMWIERELDQIERFGPEAFAIIDLADVRYVDTTFINALLRVRSRLATTQPRTSIALVAPRTSMVRRLFEITKLNSVFPFFDDVAAARRRAMIFQLPPLTMPRLKVTEHGFTIAVTTQPATVARKERSAGDPSM